MTTIDNVSSRLLEADHRAQLTRAIIASTVGTTIEWYDFLLYGQVTGLVFGKLFFSRSDPLVGVLQAFAIYAVGFLARPIGAAIFGHFGDRIGRKSALITTLLLTGLATFAVGFVPTYEQVGIWGAVILTVILDLPHAPWQKRRTSIRSPSLIPSYPSLLPHPPHAPQFIDASWYVSAASRFSLANLFCQTKLLVS